MQNRKEAPILKRLIIGLIALIAVVCAAYMAYDRFTRRGNPESTPAGQDPAAAASPIEQAKAMVASGRKEEAVQTLRQFMTAQPASPEQPITALYTARLLEELGRADEAFALYEQVRQTAPPDQRVPAVCAFARKAEGAGDLAAARDLFHEALRSATLESSAWDDAAEGLGRLNVAMIFSPAETPESKTYTIIQGDAFIKIGVKLNTTQGLLLRANGLQKEAKLSLGQRIKYTPKDFRIIIERSTCKLFLLDTDGLFKQYRVGLGMPGHETTPGSYKIGDKQENPVWHKPKEGPIPFGDPRNELGTRWMPLVPLAEGLPSDLGIHGTIAPDTIGVFASHGCARMHNADVEELYDLVVRATPVDIVEKVDPATKF